MYSNEANIYFKCDPLDFCLLRWPRAPLLHKEIYCWKVNIIQTSNRACSRITSSHLHIHYTENAPHRRCQITLEFILCHAQNVWATSNFLEILKLLRSEHGTCITNFPRNFQHGNQNTKSVRICCVLSEMKQWCRCHFPIMCSFDGNLHPQVQ
jgi:hypothetical protein